MSIPIDRLYHFVEKISHDITEDLVLIYRFWPHGSKKLENFSPLRAYDFWKILVKNKIVCNDQEPLNFDFYDQQYPYLPGNDEFCGLLDQADLTSWHHIKNVRGWFYNSPTTVIVLHSEKRSCEVEKYQMNQYQTAYYWSHAIISLDWFRYAEHVTQRKKTTKTFLIYNRAWSGTREYRLRFAELVVRLGLQDSCRTSVNPIEPELGIHYKLHQFKNPVWQPSIILENFFPVSDAQSHYSADFDIEDYEATDIEVVLETLFDDGRLHLTEKSLRPIACAQSFILAGTHGSLEYLRSYGFKTFGSVWDESYDQIEDPNERLNAIVDLMNQIKHWLPYVREQKMTEARAIADYNKKHFFSDKFSSTIVDELKQNLSDPIKTKLSSVDLLAYQKQWHDFIQIEKNKNFINSNQHNHYPTKEQVEIVSSELQKLYNQSL
jgi:hypothetical protein